MKMSGPLAGFTVLDATRVRAGPTAVRFFADLGARVIKIEIPEGAPGTDDMLGGRTNDIADSENLHRNKESVTINLKEPDGVEILKQLVARADVFVENYRPDVKYRLGIGPDVLRALNPRLVYASISGFGQDGPYARRPGFDSIAQGMGGLMSVTGKPGGGPMRAGIPIADLSAGYFCAIAILAALLERERSGEGDWVQTSLLQAQIAMLDFQAVQWLVSGVVPGQNGNEHPMTVPTAVYATRDGYINVAAIGNNMWRRLSRALGRPELAEDTRFKTGEDRIRNRNAVNTAVQEVFLTDTSQAWTDRLLAEGVPCGPIQSIDQVFADPQVQHLRMQWPMNHPTLGPVSVLGQPMSFERYPAAAQAQPAPAFGAHTNAILAEIGILEERIRDLKRRHVV